MRHLIGLGHRPGVPAPSLDEWLPVATTAAPPARACGQPRMCRFQLGAVDDDLSMSDHCQIHRRVVVRTRSFDSRALDIRQRCSAQRYQRERYERRRKKRRSDGALSGSGRPHSFNEWSASLGVHPVAIAGSRRRRWGRRDGVATSSIVPRICPFY